MTARILHFRPRAVEPIRVMDPCPSPPSPALCIAVWLIIPVFWGAVIYGMLHWRVR